MGLPEEAVMYAMDIVALALAVVLIGVLSHLAVRAEMQLWRMVRRDEPRRRVQQAITEGKAHQR
jgi:hypothetical protein